MRVPGVVRWTGHVAPGTINQEVVATYDIFSTMLAQAGVDAPKDRVIDGKDMTDLLLDPAHSTTGHECVYIYKGWPQPQNDHPGLWAVRCGAYKLHYYTRTYDDPTPKKHDPPLLFNVEHDPSERFPISSSSDVYKSQREIIEAAREKHEATVDRVPNQMQKGSNASLALCCDPHSQQRYPQYPSCTCNPENWKAFVCSPLSPSFSSLSDYDPYY